MTGAVAACGFSQDSPPPASVSLSDQALSDSAFGSATVTYQINSDGTVRGQSEILEGWLLGAGTNSNYEVTATVISGTLSSGTTGSWVNCSTSRTWVKTNNAENNSVSTVVFTVQIRLASTGVVQDSATITLSAESENRN